MNDASRSTPSEPYPGMPGWKRAECLGCGRRVVANRDAWANISGLRDGSYLVAYGAAPQMSFATDIEAIPKHVYQLSVAHQTCIGLARARLEARAVDLEDDLPELTVDYGDDVPEIPYTLHRPAEPTACPFCDETSSLTSEDVWPKWFSRFLRQQGLTVTGDGTNRGALAVQVPVCAECNNRWMSVLENDTSTVLLDMMGRSRRLGKRQLTAADQVLLARWAVKTAYLLDALRVPVIPRGFLHEFALTRTPSAETWVWLGACRPDKATRYVKQPLDLLTPEGPTKNSPNAVVITFAIFTVVFQVVTHFNGGETTMRDGRGQYAGMLLPLWPRISTDPIDWPPQAGFDAEGLADLAASIRPHT